MFFREQYKPIPLVYNLVLAMLWRHPENVQLEKVKAVHYCAAVRGSPSIVFRWSNSSLIFRPNLTDDLLTVAGI
jgi:hypothetical protein